MRTQEIKLFVKAAGLFCCKAELNYRCSTFGELECAKNAIITYLDEIGDQMVRYERKEREKNYPVDV